MDNLIFNLLIIFLKEMKEEGTEPLLSINRLLPEDENGMSTEHHFIHQLTFSSSANCTYIFVHKTDGTETLLKKWLVSFHCFIWLVELEKYVLH